MNAYKENIEEAGGPPARAQMTFRDLVQMGVHSLRLHMTGSLLQLATIMATAAFLAFVLGEMAFLGAVKGLPTEPADPGGELAQMLWMLAIALLVCTISNITSMLLNVTRRFREIGTMKCLGAFDETIIRLFLAESALLGGAGSILGALIGTLLSVASAWVVHGSVVLARAPVGRLAAGFGIAAFAVALLSLFGAAYPSWHAGRMLPIEAMRRK